MYISKSIIEGLKILGFDKLTIKKTANEKSLEEIFLSTLFLNYLIVLIAFIFGIATGGYSINGKLINPPVMYAIMLMYPFLFNVGVYALYAFFGLFAELVNPKKHIKPLLSVGYHTAIVYSVIVYIIALTATIPQLGADFALFLLGGFTAYFLYALFAVMHIIYDFSLENTLIAIILPFLLLGFGAYLSFSIFPGTVDWTFNLLFS